MPDPYWNHNVHYQRLVLSLIPPGSARALDVGCGDGLMAPPRTQRRAARRSLPGCRFRRLSPRRCLIVWDAPR
ncbi:hypothetical protein [Nonomuraea sp. NPDC049684]|uniref:hypothetical protein n=1 Tax=unclassified Nonomuraea TaxID=2593643 RepID=UPI0037BCAD4E